MSFLDVVKRSMGVAVEEESSSVKPQQKASTTKVKTRSTKIPQQTADGSSRSSRKNASMAQRRTIFSQLSCEVVQFQKIVSELQVLVDRSGDTPEDQWRSRILLQSAEEADADIGKKIRYQESTVQSVKDPSVRASYQKLKRDYKRAHDSFTTASRLYTKRQQEAIARLEGEHGFASPEELQKKALAQQEEEFFYRAMREREAEIQNVNTSMHKVNNIYQELGRIVQDQQEHIDKVEDQINDAKETTRAGVDRIQRKFPFCGDDYDMAGWGDDKAAAPPKLRTEEAFRWSMPFETMGEDIKEVVQKDIMGLGNDIISMTRASSMLQCSPTDAEFADDNNSIHSL